MVALTDAALQANYRHCQSIRTWRSRCEDEGVRVLVKYLMFNRRILVLQLIDALITPLGCELLSSYLHPSNTRCQLLALNLDHNNFGPAGMSALTQGLACNKVLQILSLNYCGINLEAVDYLFEIIVFTGSALKELSLNGNPL